MTMIGRTTHALLACVRSFNTEIRGCISLYQRNATAPGFYTFHDTFDRQNQIEVSLCRENSLRRISDLAAHYLHSLGLDHANAPIVHAIFNTLGEGRRHYAILQGKSSIAFGISCNDWLYRGPPAPRPSPSSSWRGTVNMEYRFSHMPSCRVELNSDIAQVHNNDPNVQAVGVSAVGTQLIEHYPDGIRILTKIE